MTNNQEELLTLQNQSASLPTEIVPKFSQPGEEGETKEPIITLKDKRFIVLIKDKGDYRTTLNTENLKLYTQLVSSIATAYAKLSLNPSKWYAKYSENPILLGRIWAELTDAQATLNVSFTSHSPISIYRVSELQMKALLQYFKTNPVSLILDKNHPDITLCDYALFENLGILGCFTVRQITETKPSLLQGLKQY